ncbi:MAG: hypothetical protein A2X56_10275 [Nitrospirae bacterium GWC2_57_13]|nr:MAG: hypothetical protein A2X56_10275 [Nitrospirae bacterium GWC2_57_13]
MIPLFFQKEIILPAATDDDRRADDQRIRDSLDLHPLAIPLGVLRKVPQTVRGKDRISCIIGRDSAGFRLISIGTGRSCSVALDIGTTNLVATLCDNVTGRDLSTLHVENPQIAFGSDILTRLHHAMSGRAEELFSVLVTGINGLIARLCSDVGVDQQDVHGLAVAGNTVMSHFFLGLDVSTIPVDPFVPVVRTPGFFDASELGLAIHPQALVYVFPNAGSYVGGDIVAGIVASGLASSAETSILIDVGTNAEVVIGNKDWMLVGAGAAGPALEEGISLIGKRASKGIIYDVAITGKGIACSTFDNAAPEGICGSGMVSLLHELYAADIVDKSGAFKSGAKNVETMNGEQAFRINCSGGEGLAITQSEISNFMKSKAAMFTLLLVLTRAVGISFRDIRRVFVAGALGTGIDVRKAAGIGMLPGWEPGIITPLGNASLTGARMLLAKGDLLRTIDAISDRITYKHMHDDPEFMKEFLGAVFIPHTDPSLLKV